MFFNKEKVRKMIAECVEEEKVLIRQEISSLKVELEQAKKESANLRQENKNMQERLELVKLHYKVLEGMDEDNNISLTVEERWDVLMSKTPNFMELGGEEYMRLSSSHRSRIKDFATKHPTLKKSYIFHGGCHGCRGPEVHGFGYCQGCTYFDSWRGGKNKNTSDQD